MLGDVEGKVDTAEVDLSAMMKTGRTFPANVTTTSSGWTATGDAGRCRLAVAM